MDYEDIPYKVAPMRLSDVDDVMAIERRAFPTPWASSAYRYELKHNANARYYVVGPRDTSRLSLNSEGRGWRLKLRRMLGLGEPAQSSVLGYIGFWLVAGEAHISTIAVAPHARRQGLGELLLVHIIQHALADDAELITLEVRVTNHAAQRLYEKYGFERTGRNKAYYSDNREDAWIMTADQLDGPAFRQRLRRNQRTLREKLAHRQGPELHQSSSTN
ncbi:MAG: Ribosomal-protein-alanine acetyltransferase [Anaerolineales bacterium]|nr:Ribosomal-protein-alanine acetyltransferase [Anaerolineales bacterium]